MTRQEIRSEVERLKALVDSIPPQARMAYEKNVLEGRTLNEVIKKTGIAMKAERVYSKAPFVVMIVFVILALVFKEQIGMIPGRLFPWLVLGLVATILGIICWSCRLVWGCEEVISNSKNVFTNLEANLQALGFCSFMDLENDMVRGRLRTVASDFFTIETRYCQACDNWRKLSLPRVSDLARSYGDADRILVQAIDAASKFGFIFSRGELLKWATAEYEKLRDADAVG